MTNVFSPIKFVNFSPNLAKIIFRPSLTKYITFCYLLNRSSGTANQSRQPSHHKRRLSKSVKQEVRSYLRKYLLNWHQTWYRCSRGPKRLRHLTSRGRSRVWHMLTCDTSQILNELIKPFSPTRTIKCIKYPPNLAQIIFRSRSPWHVKIYLGQIRQPLVTGQTAYIFTQ